ncbi:High-affinity glucose transporter SNF3 [Yarrowia sp. C11]|nr:High-affinity glucose transporter SNF3 [Yarrowia sp. E02]KAG5373372.1 High-affinity glucose transporter SNF3 [Yarrowia sp. C11]
MSSDNPGRQKPAIRLITPPSIRKTDNEEGSTFMAILVAVFVAFGGLLYGYDTGTIAGVMTMGYVKDHFTDADKTDFTSGQSSLITSILSVGTFTGAIAAPFAADTVGRRLGLLLYCVVFAVGAILQTVTTGRALLIVGRVVAGLGVGGISSIVPLYQSEVSPKWIRGAVVSIYQFAITVGLLLAAVVNNATKDRPNTSSYRIPLAIQLVWAVILAAGLLVLPETPRFWVKKHQPEKAAKALARLRRLPEDSRTVKKELVELQDAFAAEIAVGNSSWKACFSSKGSQLKRLLTGVAIQALQQLTGINFIFYYGTNFFKNAGIKDPFVVSMITSAVNVAFTIPGILFVDRVGRRKLLLIGSVVMCVSQMIVAAVGTALDSQVSSKVLIAFTCTFIAGFASTWGPIAWVVVAEIFPLRIRAKGVAISVASNWIFNFAIAFATPYLVDKKPGSAGLESKVFFIWGGCNFLAILFVYYYVYETKGLALEQVDEMYSEVKYAWQSGRFVPSVKVAVGPAKLEVSPDRSFFDSDTE